MGRNKTTFPENKILNTLLKFLDQIWNAFVAPELSREDRARFYKSITVNNIRNIRYMMGLTLLMSIVSFVVVNVLVKFRFPEEYSQLNFHAYLPPLLFIPLAVLVFIVLPVPRKEEVTMRHRMKVSIVLGLFIIEVMIIALLKQETTILNLGMVIVALIAMGNCKVIIGILWASACSYVACMYIFGDSDQSRVFQILEVLLGSFVVVWVLLIRQKSLIVQFKSRQLILEQNLKLGKMNDLLKEFSMLDHLTGIPNRRSFDSHLASEWQRARRGAWSLGLLMIDIDRFKAYNDRFGHQQGDECLKRVSRALQGSVHRAGDMTARYGGEEFAVILPGDTAEGLRILGEQLCQAVANLDMRHPDVPWGYVSVSVGASYVFPGSDCSPEKLLQAADRALYRAKFKGRNRVEVQKRPPGSIKAC